MTNRRDNWAPGVIFDLDGTLAGGGGSPAAWRNMPPGQEGKSARLLDTGVQSPHNNGRWGG